MQGEAKGQTYLKGMVSSSARSAATACTRESIVIPCSGRACPACKPCISPKAAHPSARLLQRDMNMTEAQRALGLMRSSKYTTPFAEKSSAASRANLVMQVQMWTMSRGAYAPWQRLCACESRSDVYVIANAGDSSVSADKLSRTTLALPDYSGRTANVCQRQQGDRAPLQANVTAPESVPRCLASS